MQPRSRTVEEDRLTDFHFDIAVPHRVVSAHALANAFRPAPEHAKADPVPEHRRVCDRGHIAFIVRGGRGGGDRYEMRAGAQSRTAIDRLEPDVSGPLRVKQRRALRQNTPDVIL